MAGHVNLVLISRYFAVDISYHVTYTRNQPMKQFAIFSYVHRFKSYRIFSLHVTRVCKIPQINLVMCVRFQISKLSQYQNLELPDVLFLQLLLAKFMLTFIDIETRVRARIYPASCEFNYCQLRQLRGYRSDVNSITSVNRNRIVGHIVSYSCWQSSGTVSCPLK